MNRSGLVVLGLLFLATAAYAGGITRTDAGACPTIEGLQAHVAKAMKGQHSPLPPSCVMLDPQIRVEGPFGKEEAIFGESMSEYVLIGVPDGRKLWTLGSWIIFDSSKPKPAKVEAGTYYATRKVNVRDEPGLKGRLIFSLPDGTEVTISDSKAVKVDGYVWSRIETDTGRRGWSAVNLFSNVKPAGTASQPLAARVRMALEKRWPIDAVGLRGKKLTIVFGQPALEYEHYYAIIPTACGEIASSTEQPAEIEVLNKFKGFGFVYERPDLCGDVNRKSGKAAEIAIAMYTHVR